MGIIESSDAFTCSEKGLVARALVIVNSTLPHRILNPTDTVQTICKGSIIIIIIIIFIYSWYDY